MRRRSENSSRRPKGKATELMYQPFRSDTEHGGLVRAQVFSAAQNNEGGQAMVEFALILFPLLLIVVGVIQFGIGSNYWLDMQRIANQGARWASVNCGQSATVPPTFNPCDPSLDQTIVQQAQTQGLRNSICAEISFPAAGQPSGYSGKHVGDPVKVRLESEFDLLPILGVGR